MSIAHIHTASDTKKMRQFCEPGNSGPRPEAALRTSNSEEGACACVALYMFEGFVEVLSLAFVCSAPCTVGCCSLEILPLPHRTYA